MVVTGFLVEGEVEEVEFCSSLEEVEATLEWIVSAAKPAPFFKAIRKLGVFWSFQASPRDDDLEDLGGISKEL